MKLLARRIGAPGLMVASMMLTGCAGTPRSLAPVEAPKVLGDDRLCQGDAADPKAERDPRCAATTTHEPVVLVSHLAGCRAGARGGAAFALGGEILATLLPGERKTFLLPRGDVTLTITEGGRTQTRELSLGGSGPLLVEVGCAPETFSGEGLQPLVLEGPSAACPGTGPVKVRAGGLDLEVAPGEVHTLFLPRGSHIVKAGGVASTVEVGAGGAVVPLGSACTAGP